MERTNFINLLEEYKSKALQQNNKECKVQAALLISDEFKAAILELETASKNVYAGIDAVEEKFKEIVKLNELTQKHGYFYCNRPTTTIFDAAIDGLADKIRMLDSVQNKRKEICNKFDSAISAAKRTRSAAKLKELADALGIETTIEVS
jgi:hypothetical protein